MTVDARVELDVIGALEGTDKSSSESFAWDYLRQYEFFFSRFRDEPINFIEIGVQRGPSLKVWKAFFRNATIIGLDIDIKCARLAEPRVVIEIGSQEDPGFLERVCAKYPPSIIIDDGSHLAHHMIYTFERAFPALLPGGLYVIEDFAFHFGPTEQNVRGLGDISAPDYFLGLARERLGRIKPTANDWGTRRYLLEQIDAISIIGGAMIIQKKFDGRDIARAVEVGEAHLAATAAGPEGYTRFANYMMVNGGSLRAAEQVARSALESTGFAKGSVRPLAEMLVRQGRLDEALDLARQSVEANEGDSHRWMFLGYLHGVRDDAEAQASCYRKAVALEPSDRPDFRWHLSLITERLGHLEEAVSYAAAAVAMVAGQAQEAEWADRLRSLQARLAAASAAANAND